MLNRKLISGKIFSGLMLAILALMSIVLLLNGNKVLPAAAQTTRDPCRDELGNEICPFFGSNDGRINLNSETAPLAGYCSAGNAVAIYEIVNMKGEFRLQVDSGQVYNAVVAAINSNSAVNISTVGTTSLSAQPSGLLVMSHASGYQYSFDPIRCGIVAPKGNVDAPVQVPPANNPGTSGTTGNNTPVPRVVVAATSKVPAEIRQADGTIIYVVQGGDTLSAIAVRYKTTVAELRRLNSLLPNTILKIGTRLIVKLGPNSIVITVTPLPGETLMLPSSTPDGRRVIVASPTSTTVVRPTLIFPTATVRVPRTPPPTNTPAGS